jgi:DNA gyrase subunit B
MYSDLSKPLNVEKKRLDQVLANDEFRSIIAALGTSIGEDFDITSLKYDKVIILADADQDGAHIRAILVTFFYRYFPDLIKEGHIYIGLSPLYKVTKGDKMYYAYTDEELKMATEEFGKNYTIQRYKGLGEMNPDQLRETTLDPAKRRMIRVQIGDVQEAEGKIEVLMGDKADARHDYITKYANFNKRDAYEDMVDAKSTGNK